MSECESFLSYLFKDACFPPECEDGIKIKTSSDIKAHYAQIVFRNTLQAKLLLGREDVDPNLSDTSDRNLSGGLLSTDMKGWSSYF